MATDPLYDANIIFSFSVMGITVVPNLNGLENVVSVVFLNMKGELNGAISIIPLQIELSAPPSDAAFIPLTDLTETQLLNWTNNQLTDDYLNPFKVNMGQNLSAILAAGNPIYVNWPMVSPIVEIPPSPVSEEQPLNNVPITPPLPNNQLLRPAVNSEI